ncbi:MAG: VPLPA-CTERM sorting domain-containing protein [Methylococcales bacterium]
MDNIKIAANVSAVPVPGAVWLLGSGLAGLVGLQRRKKSM